MTDEKKVNTNLHWYAAQVASGFEKKTIQELTVKVVSEGLEDQFGEMVMPTETVLELKNGKKRKLERKLLPGYVFISMNMDNDDAWYLVRNASKVLGFLGGKKGKKPVPMPQHEVDSLLQRSQDDEEAPKMKVMFDVGEMVQLQLFLLLLSNLDLKCLLQP